MNSRFIIEVDTLPDPPANLVDDVNDIPRLRINDHPDKSYEYLYASYTTLPELEEFYQQFFDYPIACRYQLINGALDVHTDAGFGPDTLWKYNYLFTTGGDVETRFWTSVDDPELVYSVVCDANKWYRLNASEPHSTTATNSTRFSLVIRKEAIYMSEEELSAWVKKYGK